jgi:hypothetical protein
MNRILKVIRETSAQLMNQVSRLPQSIASGLRLRRQQGALNTAEAERLDRIRHPSKYLGK